MKKNTHSVINFYTFMKRISRINTDKLLGQRLAQLRKVNGISQKDAAKELGISQRILCYYEKKAHHIPADILPTIAKVLKIRLDELVGIKLSKEEKIKPKHSRI